MVSSTLVFLQILSSNTEQDEVAEQWIDVLLEFEDSQGRSQKFQKGVSINGRIIIKQVSLGVQLQMLTNRTRVNFEFNTFLPNKSIIIL